MAFLVQPHEISKARRFPFKEEEIEALRAEGVALGEAEVGLELWLSLLLCRSAPGADSLWGDARPQGYHPTGTQVVTLRPQCCLECRPAQRSLQDRGPAKTLLSNPGCLAGAMLLPQS